MVKDMESFRKEYFFVQRTLEQAFDCMGIIDDCVYKLDWAKKRLRKAWEILKEYDVVSEVQLGEFEDYSRSVENKNE